MSVYLYFVIVCPVIVFQLRYPQDDPTNCNNSVSDYIGNPSTPRYSGMPPRISLTLLARKSVEGWRNYDCSWSFCSLLSWRKIVWSRACGLSLYISISR